MSPQRDGTEDAADHGSMDHQLHVTATKNPHAPMNRIGSSRRQRHQQHLHVAQVNQRMILRKAHYEKGTSARFESSPQGCATTKR